MKPKVIAIVPCRADSRRIKGKNKKLLCGKPLVSYTIEQALNCKFLDEIIVSTDDEDIIEICQPYGKNDDRLIVHNRDPIFAQDNSLAWEVVGDACTYYKKYEDILDNLVIFYLQPTSPLRLPIDIARCWDIYRLYGLSILSVNEYLPDRWKPNGAIYIKSYKEIIKDKSFYDNVILHYVMPIDRSINIDYPFEWDKATELMKERLRSNAH